MIDKGNKNTRLAYKILDYINGEISENKRWGPFTEIGDVSAISKIIEEFDGREAVSLKFTHPHVGYLRLVTKE